MTRNLSKKPQAFCSRKKIIKKSICAPDFLNDPIDYKKSFSRGLRVDFGDLTMLFISGTASIDKSGESCCKGGFAGQARRTFQNLTALLYSEGATWHNIAQTRCYLKNMRDYDKFNKIRNQFFKNKRLDPFPASVCIEANLCRPELLIEIEAIALLETGNNASQ